MLRRELIKMIAGGWSAFALGKMEGKSGASWNTDDGKIAEGLFKPSWSSLQQYRVPGWYEGARFGIWAHWGAQCQPEHGDWYARGMYQEGSDHYVYHNQKYGHPSKFGFKDVINEWKAERWDPDHLVGLYKLAGAQYFVAMASHHDNFDNFESSYQPWNSVKLGPKKDIIGGWAKAAKKHGLRFGVSIHAAHAWSWLEVAQRSDKIGPLKGVPYDGVLDKGSGRGLWWEGYDPQDLYEQRHALSLNSLDDGMIHNQWNWGNGVVLPSKAYCEKFYNRTIELINKYEPDLLYFDDTALPLWPVSDVGLRIAAHMYNDSIKRFGKLEAVINGKILDEQQRKCMVWDIERGASNQIEPFVWQTDTCIGDWHYNRRVYDRKGYKTPGQVIEILMDVVSKNGNLLLNIPVRGNGTIDEQEQLVVDEIGKWMKINSEAVYDTKPWRIFGEGPAIVSAAPLTAQGFNEGKGGKLGEHDFRFVRKGNVLYATFFGWPADGKVMVKSLAGAKGVRRVGLLGSSQELMFEVSGDGVLVILPETSPCRYAYVLKINLDS